MEHSEEMFNGQEISDDQFDKELDDYILKDENSKTPEKENKKGVEITHEGINDDDTDVEDLLFGIEKGQLEINNVKKEAVTENPNQSAKSSENETEDMDVLILQDKVDSPQKGVSISGNGWRQGDWAPSDTASDNDDDADYTLTDDQKRASMELEHLRAENDYFPDEDPPEYDVKDRIKQLNADLAMEPVPDEREHKVMFKENPVSLVVPPAEYWGGDSEKRNSAANDETHSNDNSADNTDGSVRFRSTKDLYRTKPPETSDTADEVFEKENDVKQEDVSSRSEKKEKVLVEKDGKFELVNADSVHAQHLQLPELAQESKENESELSSMTSHPQPPASPRPVSSSGYGQRSAPRQVRTRPHSASVSHSSTLNDFSYVSPYGLSPEEKHKLEQNQRYKENHQKKMLEKQKEEEKKKQMENDEAFKCWLQRKKKTGKWTTNAEQKPVIEINHEKCFNDWLQQKKEQSKREKLLKRREEEERRCGQHIRTQQDCQQAFKQWLRKKTHESLLRQRLERQKYGVYSAGRRRPRAARSFHFSDWNFKYDCSNSF